MSALVLMAGAGAVSLLLRHSFVTILPARRLPPRIRRALRNAGPAAMASMLAADLSTAGHHGPGLSGFGVPAVAAALIAWRTNNLAATIIGGSAVYALWQALVG